LTAADTMTTNVPKNASSLRIVPISCLVSCAYSHE
jgi:hypothetical protein